MDEEERRRKAEAEENEQLAAHLAERDQNDSDVREIARQAGVFCRGLDDADMKHTFVTENPDRRTAVQGFIIVEVGRLRDRQDQEREERDG